MTAQQEQYFRRQAAQEAPRGGGLFGFHTTAANRAQQAPQTQPMTQRGPGRKHVESKVVEPKLLMQGERK